MKTTPLVFMLSLLTLSACFESSSSKKKSSTSVDAYCSGVAYYTAPGCPGYGGSTSGTTGTTTAGTTGGGTTSGTTGGTTGGVIPNPFPNYSSFYVDKNWQVKYPYVPSLNCSTPVAPAGISYTPWETRKGTVTVIGAGFGPGKNPLDPKAWYDPRTYVTIDGDQTSPLLRNLNDAQKFFWTDSYLKVRFKANLQPDSSNANPICAGRTVTQSWIKGYSKLKFNLVLVGLRKDSNGNITSSVEEVLKTDYVVDINKCTDPLDLTNFNGINYPSKYPDGFFLVIRNVRGNQNWSPGTWAEQQAFDTWGFYPNSYYSGNSYMQAIRSNDCWSVDMEVAADGTKTF